jgi:hypothetical protein
MYRNPVPERDAAAPASVATRFPKGDLAVHADFAAFDSRLRDAGGA